MGARQKCLAGGGSGRSGPPSTLNLMMKHDSSFFRKGLGHDLFSKSARAPFPPGRWIGQKFDKDSAYDVACLKAALFAVLCPVPITQRYARRRFVGEFESRVSQ